MLVAPTYRILERSTLPAFFDVLVAHGLKRGDWWEYSERKAEIATEMGHRIWLATADEPKRLAGPTLGFLWLDEPRLMVEEALQQGVGTLRQPGVPLQCWLTSTPLGRMHWLEKVFNWESYQQWFGEKEQPLVEIDNQDEYRVYRGSTEDNPFGGKALARSYARVYGVGSPLYRQEVGGEAVILEALTFANWERARHTKKQVWDSDLVVGGIDFGFDPNPLAIVVGQYSRKGPRQRLIREFQEARVDNDRMVKTVKGIMERDKVQAFFCDSADPGRIAALRRAGIPAYRAQKRVGRAGDLSSGIGQCYAWLSATVEGRPAFTVEPSLRRFIAQIETYVRDPDPEDRDASERPRSHHNDLIDAWRYMVMGLKRYGGGITTAKIVLRIE